MYVEISFNPTVARVIDRPIRERETNIIYIDILPDSTDFYHWCQFSTKIRDASPKLYDSLFTPFIHVRIR